MSYLDDVSNELIDLLGQEPVNLQIHVPKGTPEFEKAEKENDQMVQEWAEKIVKFVRVKLLESYKNGAQAARKQMEKKSAK